MKIYFSLGFHASAWSTAAEFGMSTSLAVIGLSDGSCSLLCWRVFIADVSRQARKLTSQNILSHAGMHSSGAGELLGDGGSEF